MRQPTGSKVIGNRIVHTDLAACSCRTKKNPDRLKSSAPGAESQTTPSLPHRRSSQGAMSTGNKFQWKHTSSTMSLKSVQPRLVAPRIIVQNAKRQGSRQSPRPGGSFVRSSSSVGELSAHASMRGGSGTPSGNATPVADTHSKPSLSMECMFRPTEMPRQDVLIIPAPVRAFEEAMAYFERQNKGQKSAGRHSEDPQYPLHPLVDPKAHRPSSAPSIVRWRHDPSSYQARENGADKVRQHQILNHEPPRGVSNRPLSSTPRLASNRPSSPEWLLCGLSTKRSPRTEPVKMESLIFDSAERLAMLKAAKSSLTNATNAISTSYRPSRDSPVIYAPPVSHQSAGFSERDTIAPYQRVVPAVSGAHTVRTRTGGGSPEQVDSCGTDASPQMSHVLAKDARYKRDIQYFETQHSLKQEHLRALDSAHKARQVAVSRGARYRLRVLPNDTVPPMCLLLSQALACLRAGRFLACPGSWPCLTSTKTRQTGYHQSLSSCRSGRRLHMAWRLATRKLSKSMCSMPPSSPMWM